MIHLHRKTCLFFSSFTPSLSLFTSLLIKYNNPRAHVRTYDESLEGTAAATEYSLYIPEKNYASKINTSGAVRGMC
jgi:hypothetical protein